MELVPQQNRMLAASRHEIETVIEFRKHVLAAPQTPCKYKHLVHGGMYVRTMYVPADQLIAGVKLKAPTLTIIVGNVIVYRESGNLELTGYNVIPGSVGRLTAVYTHTKAAISMFIRTDLKDVAEIQRQTVEEPELLSPLDPEFHEIIVTGE